MHRDAGLRQRLHAAQPALRARRARLQDARQRRIERRDADEDLGQALRGHRRQQVDIPFDQRGLRHDSQRMPGAREHFDDRARDAQFPLDRLVGVGRSADRDVFDIVARRCQLTHQQIGSIDLREQPRLEIEPRRQVEVAVRGARIAVNAPVLAAAVGIDRAVERNVRRVVVGDQALRRLAGHGCRERRQRLVGVECGCIERIAVGFPADGFEPMGEVGHCTAPLADDGDRRSAGRGELRLRAAPCGIVSESPRQARSAPAARPRRYAPRTLDDRFRAPARRPS